MIGRTTIFVVGGVGLILATVGHASLFRNDEQTALAEYKAGDYEAAARGFSDDFRRGVALYRAGRFSEAETAFSHVERSSVHTAALYNLGNARFMQGDFAGAINAYEQVLNTAPEHDDAHYNLSLARGLLAKAEQKSFEQKAKDESEKKSEEQQKSDGQKGASKSEQQKKEQQQQAQQ